MTITNKSAAFSQASAPNDGQALATWQRVTQLQLLIASIVLMGVYTLKVLGKGDFTGLLIVVGIVVWLIFLINLVVSLYLAPNRLVWLRHNIPTLIVVFLPMLQPVVLIDFLFGLSTLKRSFVQFLSGRLFAQTLVACVLLTYLAALAVYDSEARYDEASFRSRGDALWWALMTITTVGYGDVVPITHFGRFIDSILMVSGALAFGCIVAVFSSAFTTAVHNSRKRADEEQRGNGEQEVTQHLQALRTEITELRSEIAQLRGQLPTDAIVEPPSRQNGNDVD
jgi:hypothetical protein